MNRKKENFNNVNSMFKFLADSKIFPGAVVLDATLGKGNDFIYMMNIAGDSGYGYGFDIQENAIKITKSNLDNNLKNKNKYNNIEIINDGHQNLDKYVDKKIDFASFNLGYLPGSDHKIITNPNTTIEAISKLIPHIKQNGLICIASYVSHPGGMEESIKVTEYVEQLEQQKFNVIKINLINQKNSPPNLIIIEKR
ncbi:tRNA (mnm(5)s(2)U34)-methyltransferase [Peptostreptococcus faecalis]|uniref:tRNA (mnm(5)s(2)U34)-methyltransferase n=1 Tax=Peptostreptococcus faecalis TaxID=2045015 RepID=UPI000C7AC53A|nr:class I SAM-dependent methyltransferase [Peptostreptococcus faecalis]